MSFKYYFDTIKKALKGEDHDYTTGNISEAVILLAIPMILELGLESVFAVVDMYFVSGLGPTAIATVGLTEAVITLIYSLSIGISTGATAIVARRIGEKQYESAAHSGAQSIILGIFVSVLVGALGIFFASDILVAMGAREDVVREGTSFTRIMMGGSLSIMLLFLINGIFRGAGNAAMAMKSLWIASGVNIILCPIFIHFFGLKGAAIATVIGRSSGVLYQIYHLIIGDGVLKLKTQYFSFDWQISKNLLNVAWPASFQFIIGSGSWIILTRMVSEIGGTEASAGYQIAFRNFVFFILPAWGLSNAAATLIGQNLGAKQHERAEKSVWITAKYSGVLMFIVTVVLMFFASPLIGLFTQDPKVFQYGVEGLRIIASGFVFYGISMVFMQSLNGAGDTKTPTRINIICLWLFQIPLAYCLSHYTPLSASGALISLPITHTVLTLLALFYFKRGHWKKIAI